MLYPLSLRDAVDQYDARMDHQPAACECCRGQLTDDDIEAGAATCQPCEKRLEAEMNEEPERQAA